MRIAQSITIKAPREMIWDHISDPDNYLHFLEGVTRWEVVGEQRRGLGARYRMLLKIGSAEVGGLIEVVEYSEGNDLAWSSVMGIDQRGRWRVREAGKASHRVELRFAYGVAGAGIAGWIAEQVAAPTLRRNLRTSLHTLKRELEHERRRREAAIPVSAAG